MPRGGATPTSVKDPVAEQAAEDEHDAAIGGLKGAVIGAGKGLEDMFSAETVYGYNANPNNFALGGQQGYANTRAGGLGSSGRAMAGDLRQTGSQGLAQGQQTAANYNAKGSAGATQGGNRADQHATQGQNGNALQQATALGYRSNGYGAALDGGARAGTQQGQATNITNLARNDAVAYGDRSLAAGSRNGVVTGNNYGNSANRALESQARGSQLDAANALGYRANDGSGQQNTQALRTFASQTGQGPSAAEAQLQQGSEQSMANSLALARSGRGNNTGAVRQAMFQNAATMGQTNQQLAQLRANEYDQAQNRQLGALTNEAQIQQGYRGQDLQALQAQAAALGQARQQDQGQQQLGIGQGQFDANLALQNRQLNDQTSLAWAQAQQQAAQRGDNAYFQGQQLGNQSIAQGQQYGLGLQGLGQQASQQGQQYELAKDQLGNASLAQGQSYQLGMGALANQATQQGQQYNLGAQGLGNQAWLGAQGLAGQTLGQQLGADMGYEQLQSQQYLQAQMANQNADTQRDSANTGMVSGLLGGLMMLSDERSKKEIRELKGKLGEAYAALGGPPGGSFDRDALDEAYARQGGSITLPSGSSYEYKQPGAAGAAPGRHVGPMAQDLEQNPATRGTVVTGPDGVKRVDTGRLSLVNTAALADTQRDMQEVKAALASNNGDGVDRDALDEAYERQGGRVTKPWREFDPLGDQYASSSWRYNPGF